LNDWEFSDDALRGMVFGRYEVWYLVLNYKQLNI
jgi:hypothetical protein